MTESQLKQDLRALRALFSGPDKWTKGASSRDKDGHKCHGEEHEAVCWCLWGAPFALFRNAEGEANGLHYGRIHACRSAMEDVCHEFLPIWNDTPERKFEDVTALLDQAIGDAP